MANDTPDTSSNPKGDEINIEKIIGVINRRKAILIYPVLISLTIVLLYNTFSQPIFETSVLLKKEASPNEPAPNDFREILSIGNTDKIETEIEIIRSRNVLEKLITELNLILTLNQIDFAKTGTEDFEVKLPVYDTFLKNKWQEATNYPRFLEVKIHPTFEEGEYYIVKSSTNVFHLFNLADEKPLQSAVQSSPSTFKSELLDLSFSWPFANAGDKVFFTIENTENVTRDLRKQITIERVGTTNMFQLTFQSNSSFMAELLCNTLAEKYRETRLELKRQIVQYSFRFVDEQLLQISEKLKMAEIELSNFKSENQLVIIDESSRDIIGFLSNLEGEKVKTELELAEYRNKFSEMQKQMEAKGFFDQTFLTPTVTDERSPFSVLLEQLSDTEIKRLELLQKRKESHPDVITLDKQIQQIKNKLADYNQNTLTSYQIIISTLNKKRYNLIGLINKYSDRLKNLPAHESRLVELVRQKNVHEKIFTILLDKREELRVAELSKLQDIVIVDPAQYPNIPIAPRKALNLALGLLLGLVLGLAGIFSQEYFDKKVTSVEEIESKYSIPILALIPRYGKNLLRKIEPEEGKPNSLVSMMEDQPIFREAYRALRTRVMNFQQNGSNTFIFTSCEENTGKTSVVANLAVALARLDKKILVIDCDLRKPALARTLNHSPDKPGLFQAITKNLEISRVLRSFVLNKKKDKIFNYIPGGGTSENSSELLDSDYMKKLISKNTAEYDFILIDSPPITKIIDTIVLGKYIKNVILVIQPDHTFKDSIEVALEEFQQSQMDLLGFVINACDTNRMSSKFKYGYGYSYGYGYADNPRQKVKS